MQAKGFRLSRIAGVGQALAGIIIAAAMMMLPAPVHAADVQEFLSVSVFHHLLETDDMLIVFHENITHDVDPDYPMNRYYHFRLMDPTGVTQIGATSTFPYYNNGYNQGAGAFYFSAADAPVWGGTYVIRLEGNPELHPTPPLVTYTLTASDYSSFATQEENQTQLGLYVLDIARQIEVDWAVSLVASSDIGDVLTSTGESYFRGTITGLQYMAPDIFSIQQSMPSDDRRTWGTGLADTYHTRYAGTWVGDSLQGLADLFGLADWRWVTGFVLLIISLVGFGAAYKLFQTSLPGFVGAVLLMLMGFLMGMVNPAVMGVSALLAALYVGFILVFRNASG